MYNINIEFLNYRTSWWWLVQQTKLW